MHNTNRVPLRQLAIFDAEYPSEAAVAPTATHLANWSPDNKLQTVVCYGTARTMRRTRALRALHTHASATRSGARRFFLFSLPSSAFALSLFRPFSRRLSCPVSPLSSISLSLSVVDIRTARSNITIRSQTNSLAMPGRLPFTGRTVVSPVWPDLDCTWGVVTVGTHQTIPESRTSYGSPLSKWGMVLYFIKR